VIKTNHKEEKKIVFGERENPLFILLPGFSMPWKTICSVEIFLLLCCIVLFVFWLVFLVLSLQILSFFAEMDILCASLRPF
jgi:hypothetical protein